MMIFFNINWRDVQTKNVVNNVDMSCLRAPWQNGLKSLKVWKHLLKLMTV